jgi:hypothetical protein
MGGIAETVASRKTGLCTAPVLAYAPSMAHTPDDSALMLRYRDGDVNAFETLYRRHKDPVYRYLLRLCRHRDTAEDIFQEVWGKIVRARDDMPATLHSNPNITAIPVRPSKRSPSGRLRAGDWKRRC